MAPKQSQTKRQKNRCASCGYEWYPRGHDLSAKCPRCSNNKVKYAGPGLIATVLFAAIVLYFNKDDHQKLNPNDAAQPPVNIESPAKNKTTPQSSPKQEEDNQRNDGANPPLTNGSDATKAINSTTDRIYTPEEIDQLEEQKQYKGDDPIVRKRLDLPDRTTGRLMK